LDGCASDAWEFGILQQKFKHQEIMAGKFL
jgi:hypothetical protein